MSLLNDILLWSKAELTAWQRDAVRRLLQKDQLEQNDFDELYLMMKDSHGLIDSLKIQPVPLAAEHLPAQIASTDSVIISAIRELKHVNRIPPTESLSFSPNGITIIYGGNGSGKSGYSRVLKRACRARDRSETIHPDVFDPAATARIPEAIFDVIIKENATSLKWERDKVPPDELSTTAVFDSRCARAYLDSEQEAAYLPYGLDIVENLAQIVMPTLAKRLNVELDTINIDTAAFSDLVGDTAVGKMIACLGPKTVVETVKKLATLTDTEKNRLAELCKTLSESDPLAKAKALRLSSQRINALVSRINSAVAAVDDKAMDTLKTCDSRAEAAVKARNIAAEKLRAGESLLPGTGEDAWKVLFDSARRFSTQIAYPDKPFPYVNDDAKCILCQQSFTEEGTVRMLRFEEFVKDDTAQNAQKEQEQRANELDKIRKANLAFGMDAALTEEIKLLEPSLIERVRAFELQVESRRTWLIAAVDVHDWKGAPQLEDDPRKQLLALSLKIDAVAKDLDKASSEADRRVLDTERAELQARANLSVRQTAVLDLIKRLKLKEALTQCKGDLKTKAISDKARELASMAVTRALKKALDDEFQEIGVGYIKTKLTERVSQGKMLHKLVLDLPVAKKLDEILSEGEQRAIAIGAFLAELHIAKHKGGIVFDDPVSSLDHHWRRNVARRLVREAKERQVIVLTHDTTFLGELRDEIEYQSIPYLIRHLEWNDDCPGHVCEGLPWEHKSYKDRIDKHEKAQRELARNWSTYPNEKERSRMRHEYDHLRATIERTIQDVVFNGVVQRYRDWIRVDQLEGVVGFTRDEYKEIARLHKVCCGVVDAHDPASAKLAAVPDAKQLEADIEALKAVIEAIKKRRKAGGSAK
jgi:hypothetical protein